MKNSRTYAVASRKSPLAVTQARHVRDMLAAGLGLNGREVEAVMPLTTFVTSGDKNAAGSLAEVGGKGLFTKEIEDALLSGEARFAVHSMKDMPAQSPAGLAIAAIPPREDPRDCFISFSVDSPWDLPDSAAIGTASVRRVAQTLARRPDLKPVILRGNVGTRLKKIKAGEAEATFLALAGLKRLNMADQATRIMPVEEMLPAPGQGALCVQTHIDDEEALMLASKITCRKTAICVATERAFLAGLDGSCRTPIAGLAVIENGEVWFRGELLSLDGAERYHVERRFSYDADDMSGAEDTGTDAAEEIRAAAGAEFFNRLNK